MKYGNLIDPELIGIAKQIPYNRVIIRLANIYQRLALRLTGIPREVHCRKTYINGNRHSKLYFEIYEPRDSMEKLPGLIYVHGGGFSYKASPFQKKLACIYALEANCRVIFPDYHLAPKYVCPRAYEDVLEVYQWVLEHGDTIHINSNLIGIAGDSAGATIAAMVCNQYEKRNLKMPRLQMLVYPATDATMSTPSMQEYTDTPIWNSINNKKAWQFFMNGMEKEKIKESSPLFSYLPSTIPDTYIETAEYDCLHDEGVWYARRLQNAGAKVELNDTKGTIHGYDSAINTQIAKVNIKKRISFLKHCFYGKIIDSDFEF